MALWCCTMESDKSKGCNKVLSKFLRCCRFAAEAQIDGTYMFCKQESVIQAAKFLSGVSELSLQVGPSSLLRHACTV